MAEATTDNNGFIEIKGNRLSKPGVFQYLGREIGAPDPDKIYYVYRPKEELSSPECVDSFKLQPWVIDHKMLGKKYASPAEKKGVHGVLGESVFFDESDGWLKGNIKMFSDSLEDAIGKGKNELSLGFACQYDFSNPGVFNGQRYDVIQKNIRGNHLASVDDSRMDVAVMDHAMDHLTFTLETKGLTMPTKNKDGTAEDAEMSVADLTAAVKLVLPAIEKLENTVAAMDEKMKAKEEDEKKAEDSDDEEKKDKAAGEDKDDKDEKKEGMDGNIIGAAIAKALRPYVEKLEALEKVQAGMDSSTLMQEISKRDELASKLSQYVGTFDHSSQTLQQVAAYGVEKLEVPCEKGSEVAALNAYFHNRPHVQSLYTSATGQDGKPEDDQVAKYLNEGDE